MFCLHKTFLIHLTLDEIDPLNTLSLKYKKQQCLGHSISTRFARYDYLQGTIHGRIV
jgi:hypothetical protein